MVGNLTYAALVEQEEKNRALHCLQENNIEQEVSAGNQLKTLPHKVVGEKEGEMEDNTKRIVQNVQIVVIVQVVPVGQMVRVVQIGQGVQNVQ